VSRIPARVSRSCHTADPLHRNVNLISRMRPEAKSGLLAALTAVVIVYGSLYPFDFRVPEGEGAVSALLHSRAIILSSHGDFVANVLLYMPLGWFGIQSMPRRMSVSLRLFLMVIGGTMISLTMELAQYYDAGRVTAINDIYTNLLGTITGSLGGIYLSGRWRVPLIAEILEKPIPAMIIVAWAGYRFYPYVPTIDLHKYWNALKPVILNPVFSLESLYRHTTIWLTIFAFISMLVGHRRSILLVPLFCGCVLIARVMIVDTVLSVAEIMGAGVALCFWPIMRATSYRQRAAVLLLLLGTAVVIERLKPFQFQSVARDFGWVPFRSLMEGSIAINVMTFCEKSFLYGALLYLSMEAGGRLRTAVLIVGGILFTTSWVETYLPGRSAEITDLVMVLLLAGGFALFLKPSANSLGVQHSSVGKASEGFAEDRLVG
jgi:VanZ family protein